MVEDCRGNPAPAGTAPRLQSRTSIARSWVVACALALLSLGCADAGTNTEPGTGRSTLRPATPGLTVFAGKIGGWGYADRVGAAARFGARSDIAFLPGVTLVVTDSSNSVVRTVAAADLPSAETARANRRPPSDGPPPPVAVNPSPPVDSTTSTTSSCSALPPLPARPARVRSVAEFGATPNDSVDDTDAIQRALNALSPGEWLVFPPGRYLQSKSLHVKVPNTVLWGDGATLHATNPNDMAVLIEADGASIYQFTLTAETSNRRTAPWESRIAVFAGSKPPRLLAGNVIRGNRVISGGDPGTPLANSSSSAAIFVYHATDFLVAENTVSRSLSDGIHITSGSSYGRVLNNTVKETGDDMIAVVSYIGDPSTSAEAIASDFDARKARGLNHHITIANNTVAGQYWGRGISVVGGENITIENNSIEGTTHGAAVYLARETSYLTFGVRNILVRNNTISDVQTTTPVYAAGTVSPSAAKTGHGAIEIYSWVFTDEAAIGWLKDALSVQNIRIESNTINRTRGDGVRIGTGSGRIWSYTGKAKDGPNFTRNLTGGPVGLIGLAGNKMTSIASQAIAINNLPTEQFNISCEANTADGKSASNRQCGGSPPPVVPACAR
jgi:parallel beta-helix repeat protein